MKILLLNDNPVVNKLVTLSAQKTSDELDVATSLEEIEGSEYDLLVVDDTLYSPETMEELETKVNYSKSLYICSRNAELVESFNSTLKKPFLPTDLVELFALLGREVNTIDLTSEDEPNEQENEITELDTQELPDDENDIDLDEELSLDDTNLDELDSLDEELSLDDTNLDELDSLDEELSLDDTNLDELDSLDEELSLDDTNLDELDSLDEELSLDDINLDETEDTSSVLDEDDLQEVQELFNEIEDVVNSSAEELEVGVVEVELDLPHE